MSAKKTILMMIDEQGDKPYGWDGDGALPIRKDAVGLVRQVLHDPEFDSDRLERCQAYSVLLGKHGQIQLLLSHVGRNVFLKFQCESAITYSQIFEDQATKLDGVIRVRHPGEAVEAVRKINELLFWATKGIA